MARAPIWQALDRSRADPGIFDEELSHNKRTQPVPHPTLVFQEQAAQQHSATIVQARHRNSSCIPGDQQAPLAERVIRESRVQQPPRCAHHCTATVFYEMRDLFFIPHLWQRCKYDTDRCSKASSSSSSFLIRLASWTSFRVTFTTTGWSLYTAV